MSLSCRGHWLNYKNVASQKNIIKNKEKNRKDPSTKCGILQDACSLGSRTPFTEIKTDAYSVLLLALALAGSHNCTHIQCACVY